MAPHPFETATAGANGRTEREKEVALFVRVQVKTEGMKPAGQLPVVVKILIEICLAILVQIVIAGDLIVADGVESRHRRF